MGEYQGQDAPRYTFQYIATEINTNKQTPCLIIDQSVSLIIHVPQ